MLKKQQEQKDEEDRQSVKKMNACNALVDNNINAWISCEQATENLKDISVEKRAAVVLAQIDFYRYVVQVKCPASLFYKTMVVNEKRVHKSWDDLFISLKQILQFNKIVPDDIQRTSSSLKSKEERDESFETGKAKSTQTLRDARMRRLTNNQAKENLPKYMKEPKLLIEKCIQHQLKDEGETWWCIGEVIGIEKPNKNTPRRTQYTVMYDTDLDNNFSFPLLAELEKGNIIVL